MSEEREQPQSDRPDANDASARPRVRAETAGADANEVELTGWAAVYDYIMQTYCWMVIGFILYVLSWGPMFSLWQEAVQLGKWPFLQAAYFPLARLCAVFEPFDTIVEWYVTLWS